MIFYIRFYKYYNNINLYYIFKNRLRLRKCYKENYNNTLKSNN